MQNKINKGSILDIALENLEMGLSVIPLLKKTKLPPQGCTWKEQQDFLPSEDLIINRFSLYPDANIGIITGKASKLIVVDADSAKACEWIEKTFPTTWLRVNNNGRGQHYYFKYPASCENKRIKTCAGLLSEEVDIRADGGLVVIPPSIHKSGNRYKWIVDSGFSLEDYQEDLPEFPIDQFPQLLTNQSATPQKILNHNQHYNRSQLKYIAPQCAWLRHCREDAAKLGYEEWLKMITIVARCEDGNKKVHLLSEGHPKYNYNATERKIHEALVKMKPATCRNICVGFESCFECENLINHGKNFSPIILGETKLSENHDLKIMDVKTIKNNSLILDIPDQIIKTQGLIQEGLEFLEEQGLPDIPQLNLPSLLTIIANIVSTKICYNKTYCNLFTLKIGRTSIGKSRADDELTSEINQAAKTDINLFNCFKSITEFSSGAALYKELETNPHLLCCIDEGTELFRRYKNKNPLQEEKKNTLMTLYTKAGQQVVKSYANNKQRIVLDDHCLSILMNATPVIFDDLSLQDFSTGFFQRVDMWCYEGEMPYWHNTFPKEHPKKSKFVEHLKDFAACSAGRSGADVATALCVPYSVKASDGFLKRKDQWSKETIDLVNQYTEDAQSGLIARRFDLAMRYALIHSACTRNIKYIYEPLESEDLNWGIDVARMLVNWKIEKLLGRVTVGDFDCDCEYFKRAIAKAMRGDRAPTFKYMSNRNKKMKNWDKIQAGKIIDMLQTRREIIIDETNKITRYYLVDDTEDTGKKEN